VVEEISALPSKLVFRELKNTNIDSINLNDISFINRNIRNVCLRVLPNIPINITETNAGLNVIRLANIKLRSASCYRMQ